MKLASVLEQIKGNQLALPDIQLPVIQQKNPAYPPKLGNLGGPPDQFRVLGLQQETLMRQLGLDKNEQGAIHYHQLKSIEKAQEENANPFKLQKNLEGMVVNREKERFISKLQRDSSLREQFSSSLLEAQMSYNQGDNHRLFNKISPIKRSENNSFRKSVNLTSTIPASLLLNAVGAPTSNMGNKNQESLASLIGTDAFAQYFNMGGTMARLKEQQQQSYAAKLAKVRRPGNIRKIENQLEVEHQQSILENGDPIYSIEKKRGVVPISKTAATSFKKDRFSMPRQEEDRMRPFNINKDANNPLNKSIDFASIQGSNVGRLTYGSPEAHNKSSALISLQQTPRDKRSDPDYGNHLLPSGIRYLLVNNATSTVGSSPQGTLANLNKESPRDFVGNTRKIFYTEKSIIAKKEETEKLKEYVVMEHERLAEAKRIFNDDKLRFEKYVNEQEIDMANTKDRAEKAYDERLRVALQVRSLQEEIEKIETEIRQVSEKADEFRSAKDFVEIVISENKTLSIDIKNMLKQQIKQIMANIFRLRNPGSDVEAKNSKDAKDEPNFFITQENSGKNTNLVQSPPLPFTVKDFLEVLQSLEENNIFLFHNFQNDEEDLEKFKVQSHKKISQAQTVVNKLSDNVVMYESRIQEKKNVREGLKSMMKSFDSKEILHGSAAQDPHQKRLMEEKIREEFQMKVLYQIIAKLFNKVQRRSGLDSLEVSAVPTLKGPIQQLQDIESSIMLMFEERDYIEEKAETNKEIAQQFYDAEKKADKIRRDFRYELRRKHEAEAELGRKLKIEKRMQRTKEASLSVNKTMRPVMTRSEKPRIIKQKIVETEMTQEELDYQRYVANMGEHNHATQSMLSNNK